MTSHITDNHKAVFKDNLLYNKMFSLEYDNFFFDF